MTYWRLHYHLIWGTVERRPLLTAEREKVVYSAIRSKAQELGLKVHAAGNVSDHVHLVVSIPPHLSVAECVRHIKGASAFLINRMAESDGQFEWQAGYAALTVSDSALSSVAAYAAGQKQHHRGRSTEAIYETIDGT
jgi:putative transposase